jgi:hypothetical protein
MARHVCGEQTWSIGINNVGRVVAGFLVAPVVPGMPLYVYGPAHGYGVAAMVGPLLLIPAAYFAALVIGIPTFRRLERCGVIGLLHCVGMGGLVGAAVDLLPNLPAMCGGQPMPFGELSVAVIDAALSAAVFRGLAVRRAQRAAETATRRTT